MNRIKKCSVIIGVVGLLLILTGVTYSFFNYTRTGLANNFRVGNISFNTSQDGVISLTNVFPITNEELDEDVGNHDSVEISITGNTIYSKGIEYLVTFDEVNNRYNNKTVPIAFSVGGENIGTSSNDYYNERGEDTSVYYLTEEGYVQPSKYILVGYIAPGQTGINGSIEITAYIDADKIAITDTYEPNHPDYVLSTNATSQDISACASYINEFDWDWDTGETAEAFCNGTGTNYGTSLLRAINARWFSENNIEFFISHNIIKRYDVRNQTTSEWVNGRTVFTTSEWSSLKGNNAISFKVKVEANEGIWVEKEVTPRSCFTLSLGSEKVYTLNSNATSEDITNCVNALIDYWGEEVVGTTVGEGETYQNFCAGTGTIANKYIEEYVNDNDTFTGSVLDELEASNVIVGERGTIIKDYDASCGSDVIIPDSFEVETIDGIIYNVNRSNTDVANCVEYFTDKIDTSQLEEGETIEAFCAGTGTINGYNMQFGLDNYWFTEGECNYLESINIITFQTRTINSKPVMIAGSEDEFMQNPGSFEEKQLTSVIIPNSVRTIGYRAFYNNMLTSIKIPNSVKIINNAAFSHNNISSLTLGKGIISYSNLVYAFNWSKIHYIDKETIESNLFNFRQPSDPSAPALSGELVLGNHVKYIGYKAFQSNELTSVTIPSSTTTIGDYAFSNNQLKNITISEGVESVGAKAFSDNQLTTVTIPSSVTSISEHAFQNNQLTSITIGNGVRSIGQSAFIKSDSSNPNLSSIRIDKSCSLITSMQRYPWIGTTNRAGTTIYGANNEVCASW